MIKKIHIPDHLKRKLKSKKRYSAQVKEKFCWCLKTLLENPCHPFLRHKPIQNTVDKREFSITMNYRCVYRKEDNEAFILLIAKHEDVF